MFGTYRYILALLVVSTHLMPTIGASWNFLGAYAVFSFYMLSGFLMTLVMNKTYGTDWPGIKSFLLNRCLRIYPAYLFGLLLALTFALIFPESSKSLSAAITIPTDIVNWFKNVSLLGLDMSARPRLIPQAWSLYIEVVFYLMIALLPLRNRMAAYAWFVCSLGVTVYMFISGTDWMTRYTTLPAASLPFSAGALLFHIKDKIFRVRPGIIVLLLIVNAAVSFLLGLGTGIGFYLHMVLSFFLIAALLRIQRANKYDSILGDLSYPIFLIHFQGAVFLKALTGMEFGIGLFICSLPFIHILAYMLYALVDIRVNLVRNVIRARIAEA